MVTLVVVSCILVHLRRRLYRIPVPNREDVNQRLRLIIGAPRFS
jgi:hypothetical protein